MSLSRALSAIVCLVGCSVVSAADWTAIAFPIKSHDFGTVAVAAKTEFRFPVLNKLGSTIHIQSVRASCGCTTPTVETPYINPNETGAIHAKFNTHTFKGKKGATLTVIIDQPFYSEVRLRVDGYIRSDIVVSPGSIDFGEIAQGKPARKSTKLYYAGRDSWSIIDVQSNRPWLLPQVKEISRGGGRVNYELSVAVREDAFGTFQDEVVIITNDHSKPKVPIRVTGRIDSPLSISPKAIALGSMKPREPVNQKLVLVGREPFTVSSIEAEGWTIEFSPAPSPKKTQVMMARFTPTGENTGPQKTSLQIRAQGTESISANAILTADVRQQ
jgi:hypothetical protein